MPVLVRRADGLPLYYPTLYTVTQLRATRRAAATIEQALRAVMVLYTLLGKIAVDLDDRLRQGALLTIGEVDLLVQYSGLSFAAIDLVDPSCPWPKKDERHYAVGGRVVLPDAFARVGSETAHIRLLYIRAYLEWRIQHAILRMPAAASTTTALVAAASVLRDALASRSRGSGRSQSAIGRQGLTVEQRQLLQNTIDPDADQSPWLRGTGRRRNELLVRWLNDLGLRRGELLGVRVTDINFRANEVFIAKRPHDPLDPRIRQPNAKTRARLLPLSDDLVRATRKYIMEVRRAIPGAAKHDYLFVATGSGRPLSLAAVNKVFVVLRNRVPGFGEILSPHVLRHTWNDTFSELMDEAQVPPAKEEKWRSRLMGWSETSGTAAVYTKRHVQRKAAEAMLALQARLRRSKQ